MSGKKIAIRWMLLTAVAMVPVGCNASPADRGPSNPYATSTTYNQAALARETFTAHHPGMVVGGPGATTASADGAAPWWFSRNDGRMNIREGDLKHQQEAVRVRIWDRQSSHHGDVHNSYRRSVRLERYKHLIR
ncbi:MAG: hypothetical protein WD294_00685 [Phycisphaeraceae bacterium]